MLCGCEGVQGDSATEMEGDDAEKLLWRDCYNPPIIQMSFLRQSIHCICIVVMRNFYYY